MTVRSTRGQGYQVVRPTLADFVLKMPRGAQVIYPKDLGPILVLADIAPGLRVLESGVGSGALSMSMVRAGAHVTGYELREDFAARATANVASFLGEGALERYRVEIRDCYDGIDERRRPRRARPARAVAGRAARREPRSSPAASSSPTRRASPRPPSCGQRLDDSPFAMAETLEVLQRTWHIEGQAVRPDHRMVAHTGFLTHARLLGG